MANLQKSIAVYPVRYLLYTFWDNLLATLSGDEDPAVIMPVISGSWNNVYFTQSKIELTEQALQTPSGVLFEYTLSSFLPGPYKDLSASLGKIVGKPHLVLVEFCDGQRVMLGNEHVGATFTFEQSTVAEGANLSWSLTDAFSIDQIEWMPQFRINAQGMLQQLYGDDNTYSLDQQGMFNVIGPDSPNIYIQDTKLFKQWVSQKTKAMYALV